MAGVDRDVPGLSENYMYSNITAAGTGRVHLGNVNIYSRPPSAISDDEDAEGLPGNWQEAKSDERMYYIDPDTQTTTWTKPLPPLADADSNVRAKLGSDFNAMLEVESKHAESTSGSEGTKSTFYQTVEDRAKNAGFNWPSDERVLPHKVTGKSRCSIFVKGKSIPMDGDKPADAVKKLFREWEKKEDCICIIENIDDEWIRALSDIPSFQLPTEFFVGHASPMEPKPIFQNATISSMDDIIERALSLERTLGEKKKDEPTKKIIDALSRASLVTKKSVESWGLCGVSLKELDRVASCIADCERIVTRLRDEAKSTGSAGDGRDTNKISAHALHRQMRDMEFFRLRRYFNLYGTCEYEDHILEADVAEEETLRGPQEIFFERKMRRVEQDYTAAFETTESGFEAPQTDQHYSLDTQVSYIRVDKTLCLILVDPQAPPRYLKPRRTRRSRVRLNFPNANAGNGLDVPDLLESQDFSLYESLQVFAKDAWHAEILCGEQRFPPTYQDSQRENHAPSSSSSKPYTALDPQGFLLMLSSCLWKRNLQHLERKIQLLSFRQLPTASKMDEMNKINNILHACREDLQALVDQVEHAKMHMPLHLAAYFEAFPRIRQRHKAAHLSPVEHLPELLNRASNLDKLILNNFQILMSSVSVHEGHEGMRQSTLATWATVLAAVYLPLTLVTGIFGMNIKGDDGFGSGPAIGAFIGVVAFTVLLAFVARWLYKSDIQLSTVLSSVSWTQWRKGKRAPHDVEAGKNE